MTMSSKYLFQSERLGFRNWVDSDIPRMAAVSADPEVMEYFPSTATQEQTEGFVRRMQKMYADKGYCYFAVELLEGGEFIGFIGLMDKDFEAEFNPSVDIGWRLGKEYWNKGYATEGAKRCLEFGFRDRGLDNILSMATVSNRKSIHVMEKIGMKKRQGFLHPLLKDHPRFVNCECYEIKRDEYQVL